MLVASRGLMRCSERQHSAGQRVFLSGERLCSLRRTLTFSTVLCLTPTMHTHTHILTVRQVQGLTHIHTHTLTYRHIYTPTHTHTNTCVDENGGSLQNTSKLLHCLCCFLSLSQFPLSISFSLSLSLSGFLSLCFSQIHFQVPPSLSIDCNASVLT